MASELDIPPAELSALVRASRISESAARLGFDWVCIADIRAKVREELVELDAALAEADETASAAVVEEFGDLLVALVNLSRHLRFDPESALRSASAKFERRFRHMEGLARAKGRPLQSLSAAEWDELWETSKRALGPGA